MRPRGAANVQEEYGVQANKKCFNSLAQVIIIIFYY